MTLAKQFLETMMALVVLFVIFSTFFSAEVVAKPGQKCSNGSDCDKTEICRAEGNSTNRCRKVCGRKKDDCAQNEICVQPRKRNNPFAICEKTCRSYLPLECSANERCITRKQDLGNDDPSGYCTDCGVDAPCSYYSQLNQCCLGYVCREQKNGQTSCEEKKP